MKKDQKSSAMNIEKNIKYVRSLLVRPIKIN